MNRYKKRIEKLERLKPCGLDHLSIEELDARIAELSSDAGISAWLADDTDNDPLRLRVIALMERISKCE